jgi:hypothetical protein
MQAYPAKRYVQYDEVGQIAASGNATGPKENVF